MVENLSIVCETRKFITWEVVLKATVNEVHVSGHPPARNFNGHINWSLLEPLHHYWSRDLDSAPREAVLPVRVSSFLAFYCWSSMGLLNFSVYCTSARTLLPWKIAECPLPTFTFKQFYEEKVGSELSDQVLKRVILQAVTSSYWIPPARISCTVIPHIHTYIHTWTVHVHFT